MRAVRRPRTARAPGQVALGETTPGKARRSAMARTHPHAEASYKVIAFEDGTFGVEVSIPDSSPTIVTPFASEEAAGAWIAAHRRRVRSQAEIGVLAAGAARPLAALVMNSGRLNQPDVNDFTSIVAVADPAIHTGRGFGYAAAKPLRDDVGLGRFGAARRRLRVAQFGKSPLQRASSAPRRRPGTLGDKRAARLEDRSGKAKAARPARRCADGRSRHGRSSAPPCR